MDSANHPDAGGSACDLFDLGLAIDGKQRNAELGRGGDLALLLDGVAVGDAVRRGAGGEHRFGFADRGDVEAAAEPGKNLQDLRGRVRLDGVEHFAVRQRLSEALIVLADDVEVEHEAGAVLDAMLEKFADACRHCDATPPSGRRRSRLVEPPATGVASRLSGTSSVAAFAA